MPDRFAEIVIEASTGHVLSEKNADKRLYPASLTKMMTLYLTFDALEEGTLRKSQYVPVSRHAASQEPSSLGLQAGDTVRIEDCVLGIATKSANDCAVVLGETLGGSEEHFAQMMTIKARQLGMNNTHFVNASGLFRPNQFSSARDMAILAQALIHDHPRYYKYFSTESFTYQGNTYLNHNKLMSVYPGMDGLKTGYVYASGYNLAASAVRNGVRLIGVVFGGRTAQNRNRTMAQLLNAGFADGRVSHVAAIQPRPQFSQNDHEEHGVIPARPVVAAASPPEAEVAEAVPAASEPSSEEGDAAITEDQAEGDTAQQGKAFIAAFQPRPLNVAPLDKTQQPKNIVVSSVAKPGGNWAIQIGAYSSHDAGTKALQFARATLHGLVSGTDSIAPLMTPRGMIYRARLSGLARNDAAQACQILKGNCLILALE
jgi:D-alanyl-D-alanine carboxypeptidase